MNSDKTGSFKGPVFLWEEEITSQFTAQGTRMLFKEIPQFK